MFSPNDILTLAKAGFTAQQIGALNNVGTQPAQQPAQVVQQAQPTQQNNDMFAQIMAQLQTNAINATQQPAQQTTDDILTLAKVGFTAQQIGALNNVGTQPAQQPAQVVQQAQPTQPAQQNNDMFAQIMAQLQTNAINATQQPAQQTTDDILASIINPNE